MEMRLRRWQLFANEMIAYKVRWCRNGDAEVSMWRRRQTNCVPGLDYLDHRIATNSPSWLPCSINPSFSYLLNIFHCCHSSVAQSYWCYFTVALNSVAVCCFAGSVLHLMCHYCLLFGCFGLVGGFEASWLSYRLGNGRDAGLFCKVELAVVILFFVLTTLVSRYAFFDVLASSFVFSGCDISSLARITRQGVPGTLQGRDFDIMSI
jgi:hypothetical protein